MSVCPPHGTTRLPLDGFSRNLIFQYFSKFVEKIQGSLKSDKNNGLCDTSHEDLCTFMTAFHEILLKIRNIQSKVVKKIKTHYVFNDAFPKIMPFMG
jgi:hypothetical protein